ncbi:hypothetical protein K450DRAFT_254253 [Umbelopsis ramanniana AG]|uniref:mRNA decay factor PAT1 domain-containing protein n=1 Tax=Umbelopsis ramanniana AG TaxID=1314678 RepID=A0AAD5E539_UMBRA|nr:uncharacterized protein K450DRAFT_254253 [Umbelopsis ramanniana AG]KAI8576924.1 hypothetical protein K450DRAFT_254253 [Umbelopsis ramanniana AG]
MGDSFFGFNTSLPPLGDRDRPRGGVVGGGGYDDEIFEGSGDVNSKIKNYAARAGEDLEIYDFGGLRQELEEDDGLADQLIEENDDLNDVTFSVDVRKDGPDFDFVSNTENFNNTRISEDEAFFISGKPNQNQQPARHGQQQAGFLNPWVPPKNNFEDNQLRYTSALSRGHSASSRGLDDSSPAMASSSIWGDFGSPHDQSYAAALHAQGAKQQQQPYLGQQQPYGLVPGHQRGQTFDEIEAELHRTANYHGQMPPSDQSNMLGGNQLPGKKMLTMAEVEAAMLAKGGVPSPNMPYPQQQQQQPQFGYGNVDPAQMMALRQQQELLEQMSAEKELKRREQMRQQAEKSRYDKLMTTRDKDFINRIQLQQLASGDPFADDFYYQVYSAIRQRAGLPPPGSNKDPMMEAKLRESGDRGKRSNRREENAMHKMQQQVQRIVNDAKRRPKQTQLSLEGALGKITTHSVRNPRQLLQVSDRKASSVSAHDSSEQTSPEDRSEKSSPPRKVLNDKKKVLRLIEDLYMTVLKLEQLRREAPSPVARPGYEKEHQDSIDRWNTDYADAISKMWSELRIEEDEDINQHPFISILSVHKGKKLIPRIARHCSPEKIYSMLKLVVAHFDSLKVCQMATSNTPSQGQDQYDFVSLEDVELFMNTVIPPMVAYVAEAPFSTVCDLIQLMMQRNDLMYVGKSKAGLSLMTMFLSRAEILKQGGGALQGLAQCTPEELERWDMLYQQLYEKLHDHFLMFFPPPVILPGNNQAINAVHLANNADDTYVWQFLAAIAVGASMEQQHSLVTEIRDRVMEDIVMASSNRLPAEQAAHKISNVNLFLHALGLDASQVTLPV